MLWENVVLETSSTLRFHLVLVIRIYIKQHFIYWEGQAIRIVVKWKTLSKALSLPNMLKTQYYIKHNSKYATYCHMFFSFIKNIIDKKLLLVTELNKFGVLGLQYFEKGFLPCHMTEFSFDKP